ncbi:MAG: phosphate/phosphite/phosphonate ABC transporter substrate-binding protein [Nitrospirota bacterium]|nr:MAG: phosphate/phosphite/phosphonate ABC transporter substrate-binding protein [Nitrospirota bacterium]
MRRLFKGDLLRCILLSFVTLFYTVISGQATATGSDTAPLTFISLPVENVSIMYEKFLPLKEYLERAVNRKIIFKVAQNYQDAIQQVGTGNAQLAYLDPSSYCETRSLYEVIPVARAINSGLPTYKSVIVARHDSKIEKIVDGKGSRLALGNKSSSSSYLIPAVMFKEVGIELKDFSSVDYLEEEDRIALSIMVGRHDLGGMSLAVANKYLKDGIKIIKTSESIPQFSIVAHRSLPDNMIDKIRAALTSIDKEKDVELVKAMGDIEGFAEVVDRDFDVVRVMIRNLSGTNYLKYDKDTNKVAILPLYSAITLYDRFDPLMRYLSDKTGREFKLVIPKDFETFFDTIASRKVEYSYSNPYIYTLLADKRYLSAFTNTIKPPTGDIFRGVIITHKDSKINKISDLKGKQVMIVSPLSAAGFLAQNLFLLENGIDVMKDMKVIDGKRQEEVILNVYRKDVDVGFVRETAPIVLKEEIDLDEIRILASTPYIPNWPFAATPKADKNITEIVQKHLIALKDPYVLESAKISGFKAASDRDFDVLREWIKRHDNK